MKIHKINYYSVFKCMQIHMLILRLIADDTSQSKMATNSQTSTKRTAIIWIVILCANYQNYGPAYIVTPNKDN